MKDRKATRAVHVGDIQVGGGAPVVVQSMTSTDTRDVAATSEQIGRLADAGCEIARVAVPDRDAALVLAEICRRSSLPIIADIHFDDRLALLAIDQGIHGIRINPGNIPKDKFKGDRSGCEGPERLHPTGHQRRLPRKESSCKIRRRDSVGARGKRLAERGLSGGSGLSCHKGVP